MIQSVVPIISMPHTSLHTASSALARAFVNDPLQKYTFPDEEERRMRSPAHFRCVLEFGLKYGEVLMPANGCGALVLLAPGETQITDEKAEAGGLKKLPELIGDEAAERFYGVLGFLDPFHTASMPDPHWYVMVVGVDPEWHGAGLGKALINEVVSKSCNSGMPVYLETAEQSNLGFYNRLGFETLHNLVDPGSSLPLWTMRFQP